MTIINNRKYRLTIIYVGWFGRKLYWAKDKVHWGYIHQLGLGPFCTFVDIKDSPMEVEQ